MTERLVWTRVGWLHRGQRFRYVGRLTSGLLYARSVSADGRIVNAFKSKDPNGHRSLRYVDVNTITSITKDYADDHTDEGMDDRPRGRRAGAATSRR
jgi:hypothetical protein